MTAKPVVALVGRPNVGKSTLFNRLTRSRDALIADLPGRTRERHYGEGRLGPRPYFVVDTGGFEPVVKEGITFQMAKQTRQAIAESDAVIFVVDGRNGVAPQDMQIADLLRKTGRPVTIAVNKLEGLTSEGRTAEFYELGLGDPIAISSAHGDGVFDLIEQVLSAFPKPPEDDSEDDIAEKGLRVAIVGRPNAGKSTLINTLLGEERVIAFDFTRHHPRQHLDWL